MNKEFLNNLMKKSNLKNTDYHVYNTSNNSNKNKGNNSKITYNKILTPNFKDYVVLDFETTGFSHMNDKILEIGALKIKNHKIIGTFETLINPQVSIPPFISSKINITNDMVHNKPNIDKVFGDLINFIGNNTLVIHNASFDMRFLIQNGENLGYIINNGAFDTIYSSKDILKKNFPYLEKYNLEYLCRSFGIENKNTHRAMSDVLATYQIYELIFYVTSQNINFK